MKGAALLLGCFAVIVLIAYLAGQVAEMSSQASVP